jgi:hypothetical protein
MYRVFVQLVVPVLCAPAALGQPDRQQTDLLEALLRTTAQGDVKHESEFFRSLSELARRQELQPSDYLNYDSGKAQSGRSTAILTEGRAVAVAAEGKQYVVAILGTRVVAIPGVMAQQLVLLDGRGKVLDRLACGINSRYGILFTEVSDKPATDGAQLAVRFKPNFPHLSTWHNWHTVTYDGKPYSFYVEQKDDPVNWMEKGLVRGKFQQGKFQVVFPELKQPDGEKQDK